MSQINIKDYSLVGKSSKSAVEQGLAEADWYSSPLTRIELKDLLTRKNWPAIRDTTLWFGLLIGFAVWSYMWWGSWEAIFPMAIYGVLYASSSDSRWHESSHGTAFKTDWLNEVLYEIASFMVLRESTPWRWSHTRHHSDTIIVGRDPEIAVPRPPDLKALFLSFFNLQAIPKYFKQLLLHSVGRLGAEEKSYLPEDQYKATFFKARIYLSIYIGVIIICFYSQSIFPLMLIGLPNIYGAWLMPIYGYTQHAGLAENVLDHRLNCRTIKMNLINRFLYWNMNYHLEHHMFPLVPYHQLPKLHKLIRNDCPAPYSSLWEAYKEIVPTVLKQVKDPTYYVKRLLPQRNGSHAATDKAQTYRSDSNVTEDGWVEVCDASHLGQEDVIRFDHNGQTYALYQTKEGSYHGTDGICTHGNTHLAEGLVKGKLVECPKHNGRFDITDGSPARKPVCVALKTYPVKVEGSMLKINVSSRSDNDQQTHQFKVISNKNVSTFIKELVLEPLSPNLLSYKPGEYLQLDIPAYGTLSLADVEVESEYAETWEVLKRGDTEVKNDTKTRRNYSFASNPDSDRHLTFNVRIALPPLNSDYQAGIGSSYVFNLKAGDFVSGIGPFGEFHIKESEKEMVYLGGGAGMAPLRSHLSNLLETQVSTRKISFWYGARSEREVFYEDYFNGLSDQISNFSFHLALSEPEGPSDTPSGFIHEHLQKSYLSQHGDIKNIEFYLCGPPAMIQASSDMLKDLGVSEDQIRCDTF